MKKILTFLASFFIASVVLFCGCNLFKGEKGDPGANGLDGRDGKDGTVISIFDAYEAAKTIEGNENLTLDEFLKIYLSYSSDETGVAASLQATINRSLMSSVTILTRFIYRSGYGSYYTYKIFTGSGVFVSVDKASGDAYVVTNCHVVYENTALDNGGTGICEYIRMYLYGQDVENVNYQFNRDYSGINDLTGCEMKAEVIGASVTYDIALLKVTGSDVIKRNDVIAADFSQENDVFVGETVYAIGNASGEGMSMSDGVISKDSEYISLSITDSVDDAIYYRVMRTTAPINHGNSGGGLFNTKGEIVGIVNAKDDESDVDNMGYVLPGSIVRRLVQLMYDNYNGGNLSMGVNKAYLGIETTVTDSYATFDGESGHAVINEVLKVKSTTDLPARGTLRTGDIFKNVRIVSSNGKEKENLDITREYHLKDVLLSVRQGDTVYITVERGGVDTVVTIQFNSSAYFKSVS